MEGNMHMNEQKSIITNFPNAYPLFSNKPEQPTCYLRKGTHIKEILVGWSTGKPFRGEY